jgi:hypothetical protein
MHANQWEAGKIMVKQHLVGPSGFPVTTPALIALLASMHVIRLVAVSTGNGKFFLVDVSPVA